MCAERTDSQFEDLSARNYNKLCKSTTKNHLEPRRSMTSVVPFQSLHKKKVMGTECAISEAGWSEFRSPLDAISKNGYKDGIHDGKESMFQSGFDAGYNEGFKNAFNIGKYHGLTTAAAMDTKEDLLLRKPTRGQCQICTDPTLLDKSISEITAVQSKHSQNVNEALNKRYRF